MAEEGFGVGDADAIAEVGADFGDVFDDPAAAGGVGLVEPELALISAYGLQFAFPLIGDVQYEAGVGVDAEVGSVEVDDFFGVVGFEGHVGF